MFGLLLHSQPFQISFIPRPLPFLPDRECSWSPALLAPIVCAKSISSLSIIDGQVLQRLFPFPLDCPSNLLASRVYSAFKRIRPHVQTITPPRQLLTNTTLQVHSRIIEDVNRDFLAVFICGFLNFEGPKQSSYADECALLRQCLASTDSSSPAECHIAAVSWKGTMVATGFEISIWIE
jgi:hypothetical protein